MQVYFLFLLEVREDQLPVPPTPPRLFGEDSLFKWLSDRFAVCKAVISESSDKDLL